MWIELVLQLFFLLYTSAFCGDICCIGAVLNNPNLTVGDCAVLHSLYLDGGNQGACIKSMFM
jgi:hypothetical protein